MTLLSVNSSDESTILTNTVDLSSLPDGPLGEYCAGFYEAYNIFFLHDTVLIVLIDVQLFIIHLYHNSLQMLIIIFDF